MKMERNGSFSGDRNGQCGGRGDEGQVGSALLAPCRYGGIPVVEKQGHEQACLCGYVNWVGLLSTWRIIGQWYTLVT